MIFFAEHPELAGSTPIIHSVKSRLKDKDHLRKKLSRKNADDDPITPENFLKRVTDLAGARVLHLHQHQFTTIAGCIQKEFDRGDWVLHEAPVAYTWDPEAKSFFEGLGLRTVLKESFYTSIHYVVKPRSDSNLCCEIQVRTLFEEIWGEIDHAINYPDPTDIMACREQIRVLSKLVGAGSRLADSIFKTYDQGKEQVRN